MNKFYTEKETEAYLQNETRILTLPDGRKESVTTMKITWDAFDCMDRAKSCSHEQIIQWAYEWYKEDNKHDFDRYFRNIVAEILGHIQSGTR